MSNSTADEIPADMEGIVLSIAECTHGTPHVGFQCMTAGVSVLETLMSPSQCMELAQDLVTAAARCTAARQLKAFKAGEN